MSGFSDDRLYGAGSVHRGAIGQAGCKITANTTRPAALERDFVWVLIDVAFS
jgi:hypothetical protein